MRELKFRATVFGVAILALALAGPVLATDDVLITEFMAINNTTLTNQYGVHSDWIELYNAGSNKVNLNGWYLTDDPANLAKWRFPATNLAGFGFMVVFASGTSQTNIAAPLSTGFRLGGGGEYLALVKPDRVTVASQYAPLYPPQVADISYGLAMDLMTNNFVSSGDDGSLLVPDQDIGSDWQRPGYDDSGWTVGPTGFGFDPDFNYSGLIQTDVGANMQGVNATAYLRMPFNVADPTVLRDLRLRLLYDDGFVAYLNGHEVARRNAPAALSWASAATAPHGLPFPTTPTVQDFDSAGSAFWLRTFSGSFTPVIRPPDAGSTGSFLRLANTTGSILNTMVLERTAVGPFNTIVASFDFRMTTAGSRADGMGFALLPTSIYGTNGPAVGGFTGFGEEPDPASAIGVGFDIYQNDGELNNNHVSLHYNGALISTPVATPSFDLANGNFHRAQVTINFAGNDAFVTVAIIPNVNINPGPAETLFNNFNIHGVAAYEARAAFGARTGGQNANEDLDNINIQFIPPTTLDPEEFDLTAFLGTLQAGQNVLAIQGLNLAADDSDFLLLPELTARQIEVRRDSPIYFATATPGAPNLSGAPAIAPAPRFSPLGGMFRDPISVNLSIDPAAAEIHYTLDGSEPTAASALYAGPIFLSSSALVRARCFGPKLLPGEIASQNYTFLDGDVVDFTSNLPLVIINTFGNTIVQGNKTTTSMTFIDTFRGRSSIQAVPDIQVRAGMAIRGQSSTMFPKVGYAVETRDEFDRPSNVSLLGFPADNDWILDAHYDDKTFMNTPLAFELHEKMGHYAVRRKFVEVFLNTVGGNLNYARDYLGIYVLFERIKISPDRVDIAKLAPGDNTEPNISGGYIIKKDKTSPGDVIFTTRSGQSLIYDDPKGQNLSVPQQNWIVNYLNQFEHALYSSNWLHATGTNHYSYYIDVDSFVDQHWIVEFTKNIDGYRYSNFMHKDRGGKLFMDPIWDWDLSFGNANYLECDQTNGWYYPEIEEDEHIWLRRLVGLPTIPGSGDPDFQQNMADRWAVLRTNVLAVSNVLARVDEIAALLNEAQARDFQRWPRLGVYVWPNPDSYWPITTYQGTVDWMKNWISGRFAWIDSQYPLIPPLFNRPSGFVEAGFFCAVFATNPVYVTFDGTDPRRSGGAIAPTALLYTAPFPVLSNTLVTARQRTTSGAWGPPATVSLFTRIPSLAITEIMYHPPAPAAGGPYTASDFEYLELKNTGANPINLNNAQISGDVHFMFSNLVLAAQQQVVIVHNKAAFVSRYGANINMAGEFAGSLGGGHLVLNGPLGEPILDFTYRQDWYPSTDGAGFSLVTVNENLPPDNLSAPSGWRPSAAPNGSPGRSDGAAPAFPAIVVNEALNHALPPALTTIELYNASAAPVDVGGWFLTDDLQQPRKFRIPGHPLIQPGGFRLFDEHDFNQMGAGGIPFKLNPAGCQIYLLSGDAATNLTGYAHGFTVEAQKAGVTFGRYLNSLSQEDFVAQAVSTLGSANGPLLVGPVVLSELMYHPPDVRGGTTYYDNTEDEYIELRNIAGQSISLFDPSYPTNTWRLDQAVNFSFPQNTMLAPGASLLVVSFDPANNPGQLAAFSAKYGVDPATTPIFGPYSGKLANSGETLSLKMPDTPDLQGNVSWVVVDRVHYADKTPWPRAADGFGYSLQRINLGAYGNDPMNWTAAPPTPGGNYNTGASLSIDTSPQSQTVLASSDVILSVAASGDAPLLYQWRAHGTDIPGATDASLQLNNVQLSDSGTYEVVVLGPSGAVSSSAVLTVVSPVQIVVPPQSQTVRLPATSLVATNVTFSVFVTGGATGLAYQWSFNGSDIPGATNSVCVLNPASIANQGLFQVLVSDGYSSAQSDPVSLTVLVTPRVAQPWPLTTTAVQGDNVTFTVSVDGFPAPFSFQWRKLLVVLTNIPQDAPTSSFTLSNVQPSDAGFYRVVVTNAANVVGFGPISSAFTTLVVLPDSDGDHIPDDWETQYGLNPHDPSDANADPDHDGMTNLQEYLAGTDPTNIASSLKLGPLRLDGGVTLHFGAIAAKSYTVQYKNTLSDFNWTKLADVPARTTNWAAIVIDPAASASRYYRIVTPQQAP